jgi:hypothetical protein
MDLFESWAAYTYAWFLREHAQVETGGLWRDGGRFCLVVAAPNGAESPDPSLQQWLDSHSVAGGTHIEVTSVPPPGATRLPEPDPQRDLHEYGLGRPLWLLLRDLEIELGPNFPELRAADGVQPGTVTVETSGPLTPDQSAALIDACSRLGMPVTVASAPPWTPLCRPLRDQADALDSAARVRRSTLSRSVRQAYEADEDLWRATRDVLISLDAPEHHDILPATWTRNVARCLVPASVFAPSNIRTHLSLFEKVSVVAPLAVKQTEILCALGVTEDELVALAALGRVELVFPQPLGRYSISLLERVAAEAPSSMLLSRTLGSAILADARQRLGIFMPPGRTDVQRELLAALLEAGAELDDDKRRRWQQFVADMASAWSSLVGNASRLGANSISHPGVGGFAGALVHRFFDRDLRIEFDAAASSVQMAGALGAVVFPVSTPGYSELTHTNILCELYSGVPAGLPPNMVPNADAAVRGILTIGKDVPVLELARAFAGTDVTRLREFIFEFISNNYEPERLAEAVSNFNDTVKHYERNSQRLAEWDIEGVISQAADLIPAPPVPQLIRAGLWLYKVCDKKRTRSAWLSRVMDSISAGSFTPPEAVLVARMREAVPRTESRGSSQ